MGPSPQFEHSNAPPDEATITQTNTAVATELRCATADGIADVSGFWRPYSERQKRPLSYVVRKSSGSAQNDRA